MEHLLCYDGIIGKGGAFMFGGNYDFSRDRYTDAFEMAVGFSVAFGFAGKRLNRLVEKKLGNWHCFDFVTLSR